ncbi:probable RNA-directed DNA polymerase from transposon BS [Trichonephila inaurata madagascariensis]|uniref:Probable RNA-directed DNA polymerase from transposon BS n=1 Tax=Trichonephila inaurata madagascariensis TaxID=2747483 RepID=A0A8X6Y9F7_9ARAC|nr:probable RNA-directed DNA polymerase from transposon BS [Trichonephila inaurata madagascariensis]
MNLSEQLRYNRSTSHLPTRSLRHHFTSERPQGPGARPNQEYRPEVPPDECNNLPHQDFQQMPPSSILSQTLKHCTITLLPRKNKDQKFPLNYRPISLISCVAKLFEKILLSRIQAFSDAHNLIPDFQHGFRKETSTCHQLLRTTNKIIDGFNKHRTTGGVFLDVEKAFDRVWHNGLVYKLIQTSLLT